MQGETWQSEICPRWLIDDRSAAMLQLHLHYKNGVLPYAGGLLEQSNFYMASMTVIESRMNRIVNERIEKVKARQ